MPDPTLRDPLRRPLFRRLAATYAVNELGDWMGIVALSVLVFDRTGSAYATAALYLGTRFLPAVVAPPLVARIERPPPRFVLPILYCGEAAAFGALALLVDHFSLAAIVAVAAFDGALALAARAITRAVVARALEPSGELRAGNAILNVAFTVGAAVGPGIAGLIVAGFGVQTALLLDAISFYLIACILLSTRSMPELEPEAGRFRERLRAGLDYIRQIPALRQLLVAQSGALVFFAAVLPIEVIYVKDVLGAGDSGYGLLLASWGAGMVLGSIVFASVRRRPLPRLLFFSTLTVAAGYLGLAAAPSLALACTASVLGGTGNGVQWVSAVSAVQELSRQSMQARVVSVLESLAAAMPGVGFVLGGLVASAAEPRATFLVAGVGIIGIVAIASATLKGQWESVATDAEAPTEVEDPIVLELIPAGRTFDAGAEVPGQSKREVRP